MSIHLRRPPVATLAIIAGILVLDQITKALVIANIDRLPVDVTSGIRIELVRNTGVSFSLFQSRGWLVTLLVCLVVGTVLVLFLTMPRRYSIPLSVLLGGSLANLIDRFRFGYVVDFVGLWWWPRFNVADIAIILGASLTVLTVLFQPRPRERDDASGGADEADVPDGMGDARTVEPPVGAERKPAHTDGETGAPGSLPRSSADAPSRPSGGKPALSSVEPDDGDPRSGDATVSTRAEGE